MTNSNTERSKAARAKSSRETQARIVEAGGWRLSVMLYPKAAAAVRAEMARLDKSAAEIINAVLEKIEK